MSNLRLVVAGLSLACASTSAPSAPAEAPRPPASPEALAACRTAWETLQASVAGSAGPCDDDAGCEAFGSCHAVVRGQAARLWQQQSDAETQCRGLGPRDDIVCVPAPARCIRGTCARR